MSTPPGQATAPGQAARTAALRAARAKHSQDKRRRAIDAVHALEAAGAPVTPAAVAAAAKVSTWLTYADGVREHIHAAQRRQAEHPTDRPSRPANPT